MDLRGQDHALAGDTSRWIHRFATHVALGIGLGLGAAGWLLTGERVAPAVTGVFLFDGFAERLAGMAPLVTDPLAADIIAVMLLPAAFVPAALVTATGGQVVGIGPAGVCLSGPLRRGSTHWDENAERAWRDDCFVVSRLEMAMPRRLRTNRDLRLSDDGCLTIFAPATPRTG